MVVVAYGGAIGFFIRNAFAAIAPDQDPIALFLQVLIFYLLFDLVIRLLWQSVKLKNFHHLMCLPMSMRAISHYEIVSFSLSLFSLFPLLLLLPFAISSYQELGALQSASLVLIVVGHVALNNILAFYVINPTVIKQE